MELKIKKKKICSFNHEFYPSMCDGWLWVCVYLVCMQISKHQQFEFCRTFEFYAIKTWEWENPRESRVNEWKLPQPILVLSLRRLKKFGLDWNVEIELVTTYYTSTKVCSRRALQNQTHTHNSCNDDDEVEIAFQFVRSISHDSYTLAHSHTWVVAPLRALSHIHSFPFLIFLINTGGLHFGNWFLIFAVWPLYLSSFSFIRLKRFGLWFALFCFLHFWKWMRSSWFHVKVVFFEAFRVLKWSRMTSEIKIKTSKMFFAASNKCFLNTSFLHT